MPIAWLTDYGPSNLELLMILAVIATLAGVGYRLLRRRWQHDKRRLESALAAAQRQNETLRGELDETQARYDPARIKAAQDHLQRVIAHEFVKGLHFILAQSEETEAGLRADQADLRDRQNEVRAKAHEMIQHARNVVGLPDLERHATQREMVNLRGLLEGVLKELFPYAEARGVHLQTHYDRLGPIAVNRLLVTQLCSNIIHNAIKYSLPGGVVDVSLRLGEADEKQAVIEVRDRGRGIETKDQERVFQLEQRGDGLTEPGSGLGLYYARQIARLHGGDVTLVESRANEGATFRITLPYGEQDMA